MCPASAAVVPICHVTYYVALIGCRSIQLSKEAFSGSVETRPIITAQWSSIRLIFWLELWVWQRQARLRGLLVLLCNCTLYIINASSYHTIGPFYPFHREYSFSFVSKLCLVYFTLQGFKYSWTKLFTVVFRKCQDPPKKISSYAKIHFFCIIISYFWIVFIVVWQPAFEPPPHRISRVLSYNMPANCCHNISVATATLSTEPYIVWTNCISHTSSVSH